MFLINGNFEDFINSLPDVGGTVEVGGERLNSSALKKRMIAVAPGLNTLKELITDEQIGISNGRTLQEVMLGIHGIASSKGMNSALRSFLEGVIRSKRTHLLAFNSVGESISRELARRDRALTTDGVHDVVGYARGLSVTLTTILENAISDVENFKNQFNSEIEDLVTNFRSPMDKKSQKDIEDIRSSIDLRIKGLKESVTDVNEYVVLVAAYNLLAYRRLNER